MEAGFSLLKCRPPPWAGESDNWEILGNSWPCVLRPRKLGVYTLGNLKFRIKTICYLLVHIICFCQGLTGTRLRQNKFHKLPVGRTSGFEWNPKYGVKNSRESCLYIFETSPSGNKSFSPRKKEFFVVDWKYLLLRTNFYEQLLCYWPITTFY